jgi:hypothetical protein
LGFLGALCLAAKTTIYDHWILLDFLGFSRPNRDLSMGYAGFSRENFSPAFSPALSGAAAEACRRGYAEAQNYS